MDTMTTEEREASRATFALVQSYIKTQPQISEQRPEKERYNTHRTTCDTTSLSPKQEAWMTEARECSAVKENPELLVKFEVAMRGIIEMSSSEEDTSAPKIAQPSFVETAREMLEPTSQSVIFPLISAIDKARKFGVVLHEIGGLVTVQDVRVGELSGVKFVLPHNTCSLIFLPWPDNVAKPVFEAHAGYEDIKVRNFPVTQPRRSLCYGESYKYSGKHHKLEADAPKEVQDIMAYTKQMYNADDNVSMMCLANMYQTGHHCISEHSDKEGQFSSIRDVVCWVTGAARRIIIRERDKFGGRKMVSVGIPTGIYIMQGEFFQRTYTHEIPREKDAMFNRLCSLVPDDVKVLGKLHSADWLAANPGGVIAGYPRDANDYQRWRELRCSYTIRFFAKK